jgi:hypothetical protein
MKILLKITYLPEEIVKHIYEYIQHDILVWLSKKNYEIYHATTIETHIKNTNKKMETYLRYIIRLDNHIALDNLLRKSSLFNYVKNNNNHKIKYKNKRYANLFDYLYYLSIEKVKQSTKCKNILIEYVKK